jgi:hypothetical protein
MISTPPFFSPDNFMKYDAYVMMNNDFCRVFENPYATFCSI